MKPAWPWVYAVCVEFANYDLGEWRTPCLVQAIDRGVRATADEDVRRVWIEWVRDEDNRELIGEL